MVRTDLWSDMFGSSVDSLQKIIEELIKVSLPSVGTDEFQDFWEVNFGFAVVVSLVAGALSLLKYGKTKDMKVLLDSVITVLGVFVIGYLMPPLLYLASWASKQAALFLVTLPQAVRDNDADPWYQIVNAVMAIGKPITLFGNRVLGDMLTGTLEWLTTSVMTSMYLFAFLTLSAWPIRKLGFGFSLYRLGLAGLITTLALQPLVILVLALGSVALKLTGTDVGNLNNSLSVVLFVACLVPFILFFFVFRKLQKIQIEGPVAVNGGSFGPLKGASMGWAESRPYAGNIPQPGDTMSNVADKAGWVSGKLATAAAALKVARPEAAAVVGGLAVAAGAVGEKASSKSHDQQDRAHERAQADPTTSGPSVSGDIRALSGATVMTAQEHRAQSASSPQSDDSRASEPYAETPTKAPRGTAVKNGMSNIAQGASRVAAAAETASRWTSGAQRKADRAIQKQIRGN